MRTKLDRQLTSAVEKKRSAYIKVNGKVTNEIAVWIVTIAAIAGASPLICRASV
ncbi:MAG: hypothetical protein ACI9DC_001973 [Gammaproteobacteria bacterium]|jgi:hypothetical protein